MAWFLNGSINLFILKTSSEDDIILLVVSIGNVLSLLYKKQLEISWEWKILISYLIGVNKSLANRELIGVRSRLEVNADKGPGHRRIARQKQWFT